METFKIFKINAKYVHELSKVDDRVMSVSPQTGKENRPFLGIVVICNSRKYCVPLTTPKKKHYQMKDSDDFIKIIYKDEFLGALNINNMIPVNPYVINPVNVNIYEGDTEKAIQKKLLLGKELEFCRKNYDYITDCSNRLYGKVTGPNPLPKLVKRCCKFKELEVAETLYKQKLFKEGIYFSDLKRYQFVYSNPEWQVVDVVPTEDYILHLLFNKGVRKDFDAKILLDDKIYCCLKDVDIFMLAHVFCDTVEWMEDFDIAPEYLWENSVLVE